MASVDIIGLKKLYGSVVALSNIDLEIATGSFFTLLGPSGCGKTTLLRTIAGFHRQNAGQILVDGKSIENTPAHKRDVGMVFQDYAIFPHLSVFDNIAFGLKQRKISKPEIEKRVGEVLETVQLSEFAQRMPHALSGGQQQRVGLARAIVINPKVLLMDEPLSNLDAKLRVDLRHELRRIQQEMGITTIYVTHDQEEALAMSDTVCVMYDGIIQQAASPLEIYNNPANRFVAAFVGANNFLKVVEDGGQVVLASGCTATGITMPKGAGSAGIVAAVRPEAITISKTAGSANDGMISLSGTVDHVSFIGREMEMAGSTLSGDIIKTVSRPSPDLMDMQSGAEIWFNFPRDCLAFYQDTETGVRLS